MKLGRFAIMCVSGLAVSLLCAGCLPSTPQPTATATATAISATSEALTQAAWDALEKAPNAAVENARQCIDLFEATATEQQAKLTTAPPDGAVSVEQKKAIVANWALNDVATSYWILGQALEKLDRVDEAKEAYQGAERFPYGRTWDPKGWFWQPAKAASDRLEKLPQS